MMQLNLRERLSIAVFAWVSTLLVWSAVSTAKTHPIPHWQDKRYIENSFFDIALQGEYERIRPVIRKWNQPLRIWISSTAGDAQEQRWLLSMHFVQLERITGLPVYFVHRPEQANVRIFFASNKLLRQVVAQELTPVAMRELDNSVCIGKIRFNRWAEITRGTVVIPVERENSNGKLLPCVVEEVTQMLGLINDSKHVYPTVFSDVTDDEALTGLDYMLLKLLYAPQLRSGMTRSQAAPIIRQNLEAWERSGLIQRAATLIADSAPRTLALSTH